MTGKSRPPWLHILGDHPRRVAFCWPERFRASFSETQSGDPRPTRIMIRRGKLTALAGLRRFVRRHATPPVARRECHQSARPSPCRGAGSPAGGRGFRSHQLAPALRPATLRFGTCETPSPAQESWQPEHAWLPRIHCTVQRGPEASDYAGSTTQNSCPSGSRSTE